jgi:hypothetical protein
MDVAHERNKNDRESRPVQNVPTTLQTTNLVTTISHTRSSKRWAVASGSAASNPGRIMRQQEVGRAKFVGRARAASSPIPGRTTTRGAPLPTQFEALTRAASFAERAASPAVRRRVGTRAVEVEDPRGAFRFPCPRAAVVGLGPEAKRGSPRAREAPPIPAGERLLRPRRGRRAPRA